MDELTSEISMALNALYAAYLKGAETGQGPLLTEVGRVANQTLLDDDRVENFVIMTWQALPAIKDLPCSFGGWIWRRLQWRRIDYLRARRSLLNHEMQVPEMADEGGDLLPADQSLDLLYQATQDSVTEPISKFQSISHPFIRRVAEELRAGYTQHEIALRLGVNPATLRCRLSRYRHSI